MSLSKKKILITGSGGFIFSNFIRQVSHKKLNYNLVSIDKVRKSHAIHNVYINKNHQFYIGDVTDEHFVNVIFEVERPDIVIHGAAESFVDSSIDNASPFITSNVLGTQVIIDACRKWDVQRLVYISTDEVYGHLTKVTDMTDSANCEAFGIEETSFTEDAPIYPRNPYCLPGNTKILLTNGTWKKIKYVRKEDGVSGFDFIKNKIKNGIVHEFMTKSDTKTILKIKTEFGTIKTSKEHTLFVKRLEKLKSGKINHKKRGEANVKELQAKDVCIGDFLSFARTDPEPENTKKVDQELARFLGYFLGDGSLHNGGKNKRSNYIRLADQSRERLEFYSELIQSIAKRLFNKKCKPCFFKHSSKDCWYLSVGCLPLVKLIKKLSFNVHAGKKSIPNEIFTWNNESVYQLLAGHFDADGHASNLPNKKSASVSSSSKCLIEDLSKLYRRAGVLGHVVRYKKGKYKYYKFNVTDSKSLDLFSKNIDSDKKIFNNQSKPQSLLSDNNVVFVRVQKIEEIDNDEDLYDLDIPNTRNFIADGFIVHNSASKASGELLVKAAHETHGLEYQITRSCNNYGPWQDPEKFLPKIIKNILDNKKVPVYGDGMNVRDWIHVFDNCSAILKIIEDGDVNTEYNISAKQELPNIEVFQRVCNTLGKGHDLVDFVKDRLGHDFKYSINSDKLRKLGWKPEFKFNDGLAHTAQWYVNNQWFFKL